MAMNAGETQALNGLMRWVLGLPRDSGAVTSEDARREAAWLMDRARKTLGAGLDAGDVAEHWPASSPSEAAVSVALAHAAEADVTFVIQSIEAWENGADPGDTLRAIRDQLTGKTPGGGDD